VRAHYAPIRPVFRARGMGLHDVRRCPNCGGRMVAELSGRAVGSSKGETVTLWYRETCDYTEHEVRKA